MVSQEAAAARESARRDDGKFGPYALESSTVDLMETPRAFQHPSTLSAKEYNANHTFYFPPTPRDAEQVLDFWAYVDLPDATVTEYWAKVAEIVNGAYDSYREEYAQEHPDASDNDARTFALRKTEETYSFPSCVSEAQRFLRYEGIALDLQKLPAEEAEQVNNTSMYLAPRPGYDDGMIPFRAIEEKYLLHDREFARELVSRRPHISTTIEQLDRVEALMKSGYEKVSDVDSLGQALNRLDARGEAWHKDLASKIDDIDYALMELDDNYDGTIAHTQQMVSNLHKDLDRVWEHEDISAGRIKAKDAYYEQNRPKKRGLFGR